MILAGRVLVDEQKVHKSGHAVAEDCELRLLGSDLRYVSRGGLKLEAALVHWNIAVEGAVCMDVGASTGGFTDCLLQHGAASVLAVDTGYGQIDARLSGRSARPSAGEDQRALPGGAAGARGDRVGGDGCFFYLGYAGAAGGGGAAFAEKGQPRRELVLLVKPQFEVGRQLVGKGGIVRSEAAQLGAVARVRERWQPWAGKRSR